MQSKPGFIGDKPLSWTLFVKKQTREFSFILLISSSRRNTHKEKKENKHQEINVKDSKDTETTPILQREQRERKEKIGSHWLTTDPRVEIAFFTSSTFPAENLNAGVTETCLGNSIFSRVSFLVCT